MDAIIGIIVAAAAGVISIWKGLLIYNEATKLPLVGGGVFGLLLGAYLGSFLPLTIWLPVIAAILGLGALAVFNQIVQGEMLFWARELILYLPPAIITATIAFVVTQLSRVRKGH
jgi:hypothetical protein